MLPITPTANPAGKIKTAKRKNIDSSNSLLRNWLNKAEIKLCNKTEMKNPAIETPANIKNFLTTPCGFILLIKIINNAIANKKSKGGNRMKRGLNIFLLLISLSFYQKTA